MSKVFEKQVGGDHYQKLKIQPTDYIMANNIPWCEGNIVKYATRWRSKGGIEDLKKIIQYANKLIEEENTQAQNGK
jgi:hypothetical protein